MAKLKLLFALIAGFAVCSPVMAKMYKWVDDQGTTHYGETIPPEYADKDRAELNKAGRVVKKKEVLTPEERLAKEQADAQSSRQIRNDGAAPPRPDRRDKKKKRK